jgi:hypothetical protein
MEIAFQTVEANSGDIHDKFCRLQIPKNIAPRIPQALKKSEVVFLKFLSNIYLIGTCGFDETNGVRKMK